MNVLISLKLHSGGDTGTLVQGQSSMAKEIYFEVRHGNMETQELRYRKSLACSRQDDHHDQVWLL